MRRIHELEKALKTPGFSGALTVFLNREQPERIQEIRKLKNIRALSFLDSKDFKEIPAFVFELKSLEKLRIRGTSLSVIPPEIKQLKLLKELIILDSPIRELPEELAQLRQLENLEISNAELKAICNGIGELKQLTHLNLDRNKLSALPENIGQLSALKSLNLNFNQLAVLPEDFGQLQQLRYFSAVDNQLNHLPDSFSQLKELNFIRLQENAFSVFPKPLCGLPKLSVLELYGNQISSIPMEMIEMPALQTLNLSNNAFEELPDALLYWYNLPSVSINKQWELTVDKHLRNDKDLYKILAVKSFLKMPLEERRFHYDLYGGNAVFIQKYSLKDVVLALNSSIKDVALQALKFLRRASVQIQKGDSIAVLGKMSEQKTALKQRIEAAGLHYHAKAKKETKHLVVSARGNKGLEALADVQGYNWIEESDLLDFLATESPRFLEEKTSTELIGRIESLIYSLEESNFALALELLKGGGLPPELSTELFIVAKFADNAEQRSLAKKLLKGVASVELKKALSDRTKMVPDNYYYLSEDKQAKLKDKLKEFHRMAGLNLGKMAFAMAMKINVAADLVLDFADEKFQKILLESKILQNNSFKLEYYHYLQQFPKILLNYPELTSIRIDVSRGAYIDGVYHPHQDFKVPEAIASMVNLEELSITYNRLEQFPVEALCQLKKLKKLTLMVDRNIDFSKAKAALPECKFILWHG